MRRAETLLWVASLPLLAAAGCGDGKGGAPDPLASVPEWQQERQLDYLQQACAEPLNPRSVNHLIAHLTCEQRIEGHTVAAGVVPDDAWDGTFLKLWRLRDTSDFDMNRLLNLLYAHGDHPAVSPALWQKLEDAILGWKYWFTDPTPVREHEGEPVVDMQWYWSENHIMICHVNEFLAGQKFPDRTFNTTGLTGAQHQERAREWILEWLDERARWGFTEWHSNVYYNWDHQPLLALVEWSGDEELARKAAMVLDLVWLDIALHHHRGTFGATHGRSYSKDKAAADTEDVFEGSKMLFDDTELDYTGVGGTSATSFARAQKYALPWVIREIARYDEPMVDRERMNLPLDVMAPPEWDDPLPDPPYGLTYGEEHLPLWWSMSAFMTWPLLPLFLETADTYNLWDGQFKDYAFVRDFIGPVAPEDRLKTIHPLYSQFWPLLAMAVLSEVNTYTYRTEHFMLCTAQDYRKGIRSNQAHAWQATLSEHALVFVTHPAYLPVPEGEPIPDGFNWHDADEPGPGYWTGDGARPRSGQHENVAIHIYAPQYTRKPLGLSDFDYRDETHAYFPQAHFDEVVQEGPWTFGKKDGGFIALYSHQPTSWREGQPDLYKNGGQPFDLVADGLQNVWIVELGDADGYADFAAFRAAISAAAVTVTPVADQDGDGFDDGFDVTYDSPSQGLVSFGWHAPLTVAGETVPLSGYDRYENPFVNTQFDSKRYEITLGENRLLLDFNDDTRSATAAL